MNSKRCIITEILKTSKKHIQKLLTKQVLILMALGGGGGGGVVVKEMDFRLLMQLACLLLILPCWIILPLWKIRPELVRLKYLKLNVQNLTLGKTVLIDLIRSSGFLLCIFMLYLWLI